MNFKKLLTLSAAALLVGTTAVGCGPKGPTSEEIEQQKQQERENLATAAEYVWQMYRTMDDSKLTGSFDVVNKVFVGREQVSVSWNLNVEGTKSAFELVSKDENYSTIKVGYYDGLVTENSVITLTPTFKLGEQTLTLADVYASEEAKHEFNFTTPVLILNNRAQWDADDGKKTTTYNIKGTVTAIVGGGSSSAGSFYLSDAEGYGYYAYKPATSDKTLSVGDVVVVTGVRSDYNKQQEFGSKCTFGIATQAEDKYVVDQSLFVDATADFAAATSNTDASLDKYQNRPVELKGCTITELKGSYIYFTVGEGTAKYNIYDTYYWLTDAERADYMNAFIKGKKVNIKGLISYYNGSQVYGLSGIPVMEFVDELTLKEKQGIDAKYFNDWVAASHEEEAEVNLPAPKYADKVEWTIKNTEPSVEIKDGKLLITPVTGKEVENTIEAKVYYGEEVKTYTAVVTTEDTSIKKWKTSAAKDKTFELGATASDVTKQLKATCKGEDDVEVTIEIKGLFSKYDCIRFGKNTAGDTLTVKAPEGYKIKQVLVDIYGNYNNFNVHDGADTSAAKLTAVTLGTSATTKGKAYSYKPTGSVMVFDTPESVNYDCDIEAISVVLVKA